MAKNLTVHALRHAQASAGAAEYDELSTLGHAQSKRVGEYLASHQIKFDAIYLGALKRHAQTFAGIALAFEHAGQVLPTPCVLPELNEYDFRGVLNAYTNTNPEDQDIAAGRWLVALKAAMIAWARDQIGADDLETWSDFHIRVNAAAKRIARESGEVLVVTSGGVISLFAQRALGFDDNSIVAMNLALKNTALNEFRVTEHSWQLQSFNAMPHFSQPVDSGFHTRV
jgi:broad specificity phosphatase PhoE